MILNKGILRFVILIFCVLFMSGLSCSDKISKTNISKISIYFVGWSLTTFSQMTCDDLMAHQKPIVISDSNEIQKFLTVLDNIELNEQKGFNDLDVRICCVLEDNTGNTIQKVSFSPTSLMQIGERIYETDQELFQVVLKYLPQDYLTT